MMGKSTFLSQFSMGIGRDNSPETMDFHIKKLRLSCKISQPLPNSEELWKNFRKNKLFFLNMGKSTISTGSFSIAM